MAKRRPEDTLALIEDDATSGDALGMAAWGFAAVVAVVLGYASWQFAPSSPRRAETAAVAAAPDPSEVTGSIVSANRPPTDPPAQPARAVGGDRIAPMLIAPPEQPVSARDVAQLRADLHDLQRRIAQMGLSGDGVSRRLDRLEERLGTLAAAAAKPRPAEPAQAAAPEAPPTRDTAADTPAPPVATAPAAPQAAAASDPAVAPQAAAETVRIPAPRPEAEPPVTTGSVPPKIVTSTVKVERDASPAAPSAALAAAALVATATVAPPPPAGAAPTRAEPAKDVAKDASTAKTAAPAALDLGGYRSLSSLKRAWSEASARNGELAGAIEPLARLHETDSGVEARLIVGPYPSQNDAAKGCLRMRALGVACSVTGYTGQPLASLR